MEFQFQPNEDGIVIICGPKYHRLGKPMARLDSQGVIRHADLAGRLKLKLHRLKPDGIWEACALFLG